MNWKSDERGVSGILVAGALMLVIGLAAVAVDLGMVFNERRGDQNAVDLGALAGSQDVTLGHNAMVTSALDYIRSNLTTTYTNAEWQTAWRNCTDSAKPIGYVNLKEPTTWGTTTLQCVSVHPTGYFRVHLPDQIVETSFGKALGVNTIATRASAIVRIRNRGLGGILPFGVLAGSQAGDQICLKSGPSGLAEPPCDGPTTGNFGVLDAPLFGNTELGTVQTCTGDTNGRLNVNVALGLDHLALPRNGGSVIQDTCPNIALGKPPNTLLTQTGNADVQAGLVSGPVNYGGIPRLRQGSNPKTNVHSFQIDDRPLWYYLDPQGSYPMLCDPATFVSTAPLIDYDSDGTFDAGNTWQHMQACLEAYNPAGFPQSLFSENLTESPRFAYVPKFEESTWPSGSGYRTIDRYAAVWLEGTWWKKNNSTTGTMAHHPGDGVNHNPDNKNWDLFQLTGFYIGDNALPNDLKGSTAAAGRLNPFKSELYR